jgi:hypothetical protein
MNEEGGDMTKTTAAALGGLVIISLAGARPAGAANEDNAAFRRVRSSKPAIVALIREAANQSKTFRSLVDAINDSDGIVFVEEGRCGHSVHACLVRVTTAGPMRLLWVKVDTRTADWNLIGAIGHELRHTLEVLGDPKVTDNASMYMFYSALAYTSFASKSDRGRFETRAAIEAGDAVRNEVRDYRSSVSAVR